MRRRLLAFIMSFCLCLSLIPALPVSAADIGDVVWGDVSKEGHVLQYEEDTTNNVAKVHVGLYNVPQSNVFLLRMTYDTSVVQICGVDGAEFDEFAETFDANISVANTPVEFLTETGISKGAHNYSLVSSRGPFEFSSISSLMDGHVLIDLTSKTTLKGNTLQPMYKDTVVDFEHVCVKSMPENKVMPIYTLYFKPVAGKTLKDITFDTFALEQVGKINGAVTNDGVTDTTEGATLLNFPAKPLENVELSVKNEEGVALENINVALSTEGSTDALATVKTTASGVATIASIMPGTYNYTATDASSVYQAASGKVVIDYNGIAKVDGTSGNVITMGVKPAVTNKVKLSAIDKDNGDMEMDLKEADVSILLNNKALELDAEGLVELPGNEQKVTIKKTNYKNVVITVNVPTEAGAETTIAPTADMYLMRKTVKIPVMDGNTPIVGAEVTIDRAVSVMALEANPVFPMTVKTGADGIASAVLPVGSYIYSVAAKGYGTMTGNNLAVTVTQEETDAAVDGVATAPLEETPVNVSGNTATGAYYSVKQIGSFTATGDGNTGTIKVEARLNGLDGQTGTFGIQYDENLKFKSFTLNPDSSVQLFMPAEGGTDDAKYHMFMWTAPLSGDKLVEGSKEGGALLGTYEFEVLNYKNLNNRSIYVLPFTETKFAKDAMAPWGTEAEKMEAIDAYWKVPENVEKDSEALGGGYYQGSIVKADSPEGSVVLDTQNIKFYFEYDNMYQLQAAFNIYVQSGDDTKMPISGAKVNFFNSDGEAVALDEVMTTNDEGQYVTTIKDGPTYYFNVTHDSYWPYPAGPEGKEDEKVELRTNGEAVTFDIPMISKTSYNVTWEFKDKDGGVISGDGLVNGVKTADNVEDSETNKTPVTAISGIDFAFNVQPNSGWQIDTDGKITAVITPAAGGEDVTIDGVSFNADKNKYVIPAASIAGKVKLTIPLREVTYTATATAGAGGSVSYDSTPGAVENGVTVATAINISGGASTKDFVFTADENKEIDRIFINGAEFTGFEQNKDTTFTYQFENVSSDQTITVTFKAKTTDPDHPTPSESSIVSLIVGSHGKVSVTVPQNDEVIGGTSKDYIITTAGANKFLATAIADTTAVEGETSYVVDKVFINDVAQNVADKSTNFGLSPEIVLGTDYEIQVTFKSGADGAPSIQFIVKSMVQKGEGMVSPLGTKIYDLDATPTYTFTPDTERSVDVVKATAGGTEADITKKLDKVGDTQQMTYTFDKIKENKELKAAFKETGYKVVGSVDYGKGSGASNEGFGRLTKGVLTFERSSDKETYTVDIPVENLNLDTGIANFTANLPIGTWKVSLKKNGYLLYEITGFEISEDNKTEGSGDAPTGIMFGKKADGDTVAIQPVIGDAARDGKYITIMDAAYVANGLMTVADGTNPNEARADLDELGGATVDDMSYVTGNISKRYTSIPYSEFITIGDTPVAP